ncbi:MAG: TonB-dependent siderophore receptor [Methylophilaceae bacterium]
MFFSFTNTPLSKQKGKVVNLKKSITHAVQLSAAISIACSSQVVAAENISIDNIEVVGQRISDTNPVKGYNAKETSASTKTDTALINVPQAITVIPQEVLKDQNVQSITEAVRYVPGVTASQGEGNRDALVFRGNRTSSDLFIDGLRDDIQTYRDLYNTDRIEVLKGPNGMIFGRGGAGGVINRVSKKAGWDAVQDFGLTYGSYNQKRVSGDFGQALNDQVAFRINAVYEDSDSFRDGVGLERYGVTPTLTISPSENTNIYLSAEYFKDQRIGDRGIPSVNGAGDSTIKNRPFNLSDDDQFYGNARLSPNETETKAFNAIVEHTFANNVKVKNSTRYADYDKFYQNIYASSGVTNADTVRLSGYRDETDRINILNQTDVIIPFSTGNLKHTFLAGVEFVSQDDDNKRLTATGGSSEIGFVSVSNPTASVAFTGVNRNQETDISSSAFYVQDQIEFSSQWQAVLGLRHDRFKTEYKNLVNGNRVDITDNFISPRAGLIFKPSGNTSVYTNYSLSYLPKAGDQLTGFRSLSDPTFDPEKFINKEIGAKWDISPNLSFTAAAYILERENVVASDPAGTGNNILLNGQETKGLELSLAGNMTDKWSVIAAYTHQDGKITKQQGTGNSAILKGSDLAETPDNTLSLWNKYDINATWSVALGVVSRSEMYAAIPQVGSSTLLPGYTRYDAAIFAKLSDKASLQFNIENLTNKDYAASSHNNNNILPGAPISGRATLNYSF